MRSPAEFTLEFHRGDAKGKSTDIGLYKNLGDEVKLNLALAIWFRIFVWWGEGFVVEPRDEFFKSFLCPDIW